MREGLGEFRSLAQPDDVVEPEFGSVCRECCWNSAGTWQHMSDENEVREHELRAKPSMINSLTIPVPDKKKNDGS